MSDKAQDYPRSEAGNKDRPGLVRYASASVSATPSDLLYSVLGTADLSAPAPYIRSNTLHFQYACYVAGGFSHVDACALLGVKPETARKWRQRLQRVAATFWGRRVSYELAARYAVDRLFRAEVLRVQREIAVENATGTVG
jgi:hypothetical protein